MKACGSQHMFEYQVAIELYCRKKYPIQYKYSSSVLMIKTHGNES